MIPVFIKLAVPYQERQNIYIILYYIVTMLCIWAGIIDPVPSDSFLQVQLISSDV